MRNLDLWLMVALVVAVLGLVWTSTDDPTMCGPDTWWNHAWIGAIAIVPLVPLIWRTGARHGNAMTALVLVLFGGIILYFLVVRGG